MTWLAATRSSLIRLSPGPYCPHPLGHRGYVRSLPSTCSVAVFSHVASPHCGCEHAAFVDRPRSSTIGTADRRRPHPHEPLRGGIRHARGGGHQNRCALLVRYLRAVLASSCTSTGRARR